MHFFGKILFHNHNTRLQVKFDVVKEEKGMKAANVTNEDGSEITRPERNFQGSSERRDVGSRR